MSKLLEVLFNLPLPEAYTYLNDEAGTAVLGVRVEAPLGRRSATGFVVGEVESSSLDAAKLKRITRVLDKEPLFSAAGVDLARWMAGMYFCGPGEALAAEIASRREGAWPPASASSPAIRTSSSTIAATPLPALSNATLGLIRTPRLAKALMAFEGSGSRTMTFLGGRLRASQPSSIAPPILPAPTSTSVPGIEAREPCFADAIVVSLHLAKRLPCQGKFARVMLRAIALISILLLYQKMERRGRARNSLTLDRSSAGPESGQACPEVSNIEASSASRADLPAQTANWNAGK